MARQYVVTANLGKDEPDSQDTNSQNPYWILVTFSYDIVDSFNRNLLSSAPKQGFTVVSSDGDSIEADLTTPLLFDQEIFAWSTHHDKGSHVDSLTLSMYNMNDNLSMMSWLNAGDWCMFWAFQDKSDYDVIKERLITNSGVLPWTPGYVSNPQATNQQTGVTYWSSGLKFVGRLGSPRHQETRQPNGTLLLGYSLQAYGFTELDATIYYDGVLHFNNPNVLIVFQDLGLSMDKFLNPESGFVNTNMAVPALTKILLGKGPGDLSKDIGASETHESTLVDSPNVAYSVPSTVVDLLYPNDTEGRENYADILLQIVGNQSYGGPIDNDYEIFVPDGGLDSGTSSIFYTTDPLVDYYLPTTVDFKNHSVWQILTSFLNEPINEIYTGLRPQPRTGNLVPTLIVRRNPYGSKTYQDSSNPLKALPFVDYPQWVIPSQLIQEFDIGKTDAARVNYVHITPSVMPSKLPTTNEVLARVQGPPVVNIVDIMRHGLRMQQFSVSGFANPHSETASDNTTARYTNFMADIMMDGHLRYSGTLMTVGIQDPICAGDNLVVSNILFHIESVEHRGFISPMGQKAFTTTIQLSHGIPLNIAAADQQQLQENQFSNLLKTPPAKRVYGPPTLQETQDAESFAKAVADLPPPDEDAVAKARNDRTDLSVGLISRSQGLKSK